jgi:nucleoside-diphosphate-sugar epimerase
MRDVARMVCDHVGASYDLIREVDAPPRQTVVKRLSNHRLSDLGWAPTVDLPEGIYRVHSWIKETERELVAA